LESAPEILRNSLYISGSCSLRNPGWISAPDFVRNPNHASVFSIFNQKGEKMSQKMMKLKNIKIDSYLKDLRPVNIFVVSRYRQSYRAGADMPLIIVDKDTNTIVSGNHRYTAMLAEYGKDYEIPVILKSYKNKADKLKEFAAENAKHGNPLTSISKRRIIHALGKLGEAPQNIAALFNITEKKVIEYGGVQVVEVGTKRKTTFEPVKRGIEVPENTILPRKEWAEHIKRDPGMSIVELAEQLSHKLDKGYAAITDDNYNALIELRDSIDHFIEINFSEKAVKA
jgi:hypothetical protein